MTVYRVLIVDDSRFMRKVLSDVVGSDEAFAVAGTASDGEEAIRLAMELKPDIITMDMEMPRMHGLEALRRIMAAHPTPVIMLSAVTDNGTRDTIKALQYGAFDFVRKPDPSVKLVIEEVSEYLLEKLHIAAESIRSGSWRALPAEWEPGGEEAATEAAAAAESPDPVPPAADTERTIPPDESAGRERPAPKRDRTTGEAELQHTARRTMPPAVPPARAKPAKTQEPQPAANLPKSGESKGRKAEPAASASSAAPVKGKNPASDPVSTSTKDNRTPIRQATGMHAAEPPVAPPTSRKSSSFTQIVAVGTSTGGPRALHEVLTKLPEDFQAPVLVVQHMPPKFTYSLAQRLNSFCAIRVCEATHDDLVETGTAYIAPGGKQMRLAKDASGKYRIRLTEEGPRSGHMPSVDVLFESLVGHRGLVRHAVLMTGMGSDGAKGMKALQEDGAETRIAESEETCVVYGMPRSAVELGAVSRVLPLQQITPALVSEVRSRNK
ncbi:chemotaxis-specific protein-glutamate methyltransferase CheB [Cohnella sp. CFH 77786]|nr:chemotaxis-specific protein-glutamate methyltransferase CheB [Cohnella sp. CFH 77786]